jgi:putative salt-induced outer membrane protein
MIIKRALILSLGCLLGGSLVHAQQSTPDPSAVPSSEAGAATGPASPSEPGEAAAGAGAVPKWNGEAEAGIVVTSGNTETQSISTNFKIENERERWRHRLNAGYFKASDKNQTIAERSSAEFKSDYKLTERNYLFVLVRYDSDAFSGYHSQITESAGYGRRFQLGTETRMETEVGFGGRYTRYVGGTRKRDVFTRLAAKLIQRIGRTSEFREETSAEIAEDNTNMESVTSLKTRIDGNLSMKLAFTVTHKSRVPQDIKKTDTITSVTLVYDL